MKYLFDTNVCIQILKGKSDNIKSKLENISNDEIIIPSIVRFELLYGAYKSNNIEKTLSIVKEFITSFTTIYFNDAIADSAGQIRADLEKKGLPIGPYDVIIAATALSSNLILITNNTKEFKRIENLKFEDWQ